MPGRWSDERDWRRRERERYDDRYDVFGYNDERDRDRERWEGGEERSFGSRGERVFGERESGAEHNRPRRDDWQDERYGGVSPAMRRGDYEMGYRGQPRFRTQEDARGRFYGVDPRGRADREEYGQRGYDEGRRFGSHEADERWSREMRRPASGGTGGYDYERGYGDAGRTEDRGYEPRTYENRDRESFEDRSRDAGDFLRRTGQRISHWFSDVTGERRESDHREDERRYEANRDARGLGPKGYKRSDDRINEEVHQRLTDDPWIDASEISASVSGGEVTLSGTVESREAKHRAERIVEDLSGVIHVQNNLRIKPGAYFTSAGRGYGDSVQEARMREEGQTGQGDAATRTTTRRT